MQRIAMFEKVPFEQYRDDLFNAYGDIQAFMHKYNCSTEMEAYGLVKSIYENIKLPERATSGSAGYDFFAPEDYILRPGDTVRIPTGLRVHIEDGWVLNIFPRSGLGFKYRIQLDNTVGIIDSDYYGSDNYGHIMIKLTNDSYQPNYCAIKAGSGFAQGIFFQFGITFDDKVTRNRNGGFGSTTK